MGNTNVNVKFIPDYKEQQMPQNVLNSLQQKYDGNVQLNNGKWNELKLSKYANKIQQWSIYKLNIQNNQKPNILKRIQHINFQKLVYIDLQKNNIVSIEQICWLRTPNLSVLSLGSNCLTNISALKKVCHFTQLNTLSIRKNYIQQANCLSQVYLPNIKYFIIQIWHDDPQQILDIRFMLKFDKKQLQDVYICNPYRMKQNKVYQRFIRKYERNVCRDYAQPRAQQGL